MVASEVRALAQRCAQAAREIKSLIGASAEKVEESAAAAEGLKQQAQTLVSHMAKFRLTAARRRA